MSSASKRKGSSAERDVVNYLKRKGWKYAERRIAGDTYDRGDIAGLPEVCLEVKNQKTQSLSEWVKELEIETKNAKAETGAVIHKKRGVSDVGKWYATMPVEVYVQLLKKAGY
jgi:Holliday junction resolvase